MVRLWNNFGLRMGDTYGIPNEPGFRHENWVLDFCRGDGGRGLVEKIQHPQQLDFASR